MYHDPVSALYYDCCLVQFPEYCLFAAYVAWTGAGGVPYDPWLRVHARAGAHVVGVAACSMTIPGTLAQWRAWTDLPFDESGPVPVPHALAPVHCDVAADQAVYVEPNVWVHHQL